MSHIDELDRLEQLMGDPVKNHERIMNMLRPILPSIIHKDFHGRQPALDDDTNNNEPAPLLDDQIDMMIDAMAQALTQTRSELRAEFADIVENAIGSLAEQVAVLQVQMNIVLSLIGNTNTNNNNAISSKSSIEASEVRTTRRVRVQRKSVSEQQ
jgi:hypothetical protein